MAQTDKLFVQDLEDDNSLKFLVKKSLLDITDVLTIVLTRLNKFFQNKFTITRNSIFYFFLYEYFYKSKGSLE